MGTVGTGAVVWRSQTGSAPIAPTASLTLPQTPAKVREDWVKTSGIKYFQTPEFQDDLDL